MLEDDEQRHPSLRAGARDVDHQGVEHLGHRLHCPVYLAGAHPHALAVDGRVRAAVDHRRATGGDLDPVPVPPDAGEVLEVAGPVARAVLIPPQVQRHRGHRLGDHQLAHLVDDRASLVVERLHRGPQRSPLELPAVDGQQRDTADERGADVGSTAGREQPGVAADLVVHPLEALGRQRRAGRADGAEALEAAARGRRHPGLHARRHVAGAGAEAAHLGLLGQVPEHVHVRVGGAAVIEHDRGGRQQHPDEEVPHHPAGGREPEDPVPLLRVQVQVELLQVLEQDPALAVHDRLRQAGGPRRVQDPERVVERNLLEPELRAAPRG